MNPLSGNDDTDPGRDSEEAADLSAHCEALTERNAELSQRNVDIEARCRALCRDLRVPAESILEISAALGERLLPEARLELAKIEAAARRMAETMDAMLRLTRVTQMELSRRPVDVSDLAERVVEDLQRRDPARAVTVEIQPSLTASGDAWMVRVVLENLISNAWRFSAPRTQASVTVGCEERAGESVYFVRDNGVGFERSLAPKLFRPFERLHDGLSGTGLGLVSVQGVVERHGGRVWAESVAGQGATFYFTLPAPRAA